MDTLADPEFQSRAEALRRASTPDPYVDSWSQANAAADAARRDLARLIQAACPEGVRFTGVQRFGSRILYCFNVETPGGTSFSIEPPHLSPARIAGETRAARFRISQTLP